MRHLLSTSLAAGLLLQGSVAAQTLEDALVSAYLTNPDLESQRAALRGTDELVPQALSDRRPSLTLDNSAAFANVDTPSSNGSVNTLSTSVLVDQNVYTGGRIDGNIERAERLVRLERARLSAIEQDVLLNAVTAYSDLLTALSVLELAIQNENRLRRQLQATQDRFEVGEVTRTDVAQAEASLAGSVSDRIQAEGDILAAEAIFRQVINQEPVQLSVPDPLRELPANEAEAQELAQAFNPNITIAQFDLAASRSDIRIARSSLLPQVSLRGEFTYTEEPSLNLDNQRTASIGANVTVPLYQGGGEYSRVRQTKQTVRQREDDLEATFRAVRQEVTASWQSLTTARSRIQSITEQVRAAEVALEGSRQEALVGQRTTLDVLDDEQTLFGAQVDLVRAQRDEIVASYRLRAAIGQLTANGIELPLEPYDPEAHYNSVRNRLFGLGEDVDVTDGY